MLAAYDSGKSRDCNFMHTLRNNAFYHGSRSHHDGELLRFYWPCAKLHLTLRRLCLVFLDHDRNLLPLSICKKTAPQHLRDCVYVTRDFNEHYSYEHYFKLVCKGRIGSIPPNHKGTVIPTV